VVPTAAPTPAFAAASFACLKHSARIAAISLFGAASTGKATPKAETSKAKEQIHRTLSMFVTSLFDTHQFVFFGWELVQASEKRRPAGKSSTGETFLAEQQGRRAASDASGSGAR
jgi:hypothetical protein